MCCARRRLRRSSPLVLLHCHDSSRSVGARAPHRRGWADLGRGSAAPRSAARNGATSTFPPTQAAFLKQESRRPAVLRCRSGRQVMRCDRLSASDRHRGHDGRGRATDKEIDHGNHRHLHQIGTARLGAQIDQWGLEPATSGSGTNYKCPCLCRMTARECKDRNQHFAGAQQQSHWTRVQLDFELQALQS